MLNSAMILDDVIALILSYRCIALAVSPQILIKIELSPLEISLPWQIIDVWIPVPFSVLSLKPTKVDGDARR